MSVQVQTDLMNFRVPVEVRDDFRNVCKLNHKSMSSQLVNMMKSYIQNESENFHQSQSKLNEFRNTLKTNVERVQSNSGDDLPTDFVSTSQWGSKLDYYNF